jgi:hypothetical protein
MSEALGVETVVVGIVFLLVMMNVGGAQHGVVEDRHGKAACRRRLARDLVGREAGRRCASGWAQSGGTYLLTVDVYRLSRYYLRRFSPLLIERPLVASCRIAQQQPCQIRQLEFHEQS